MIKYCYSRNGLEWRMVVADYAPQSGEAVFDHFATTDELSGEFPGYAAAANDESLKHQIVELEAQQTPRRVAEAIAGTDGGWLTNLRSQITTLRAQLS